MPLTRPPNSSVRAKLARGRMSPAARAALQRQRELPRAAAEAVARAAITAPLRPTPAKPSPIYRMPAGGIPDDDPRIIAFRRMLADPSDENCRAYARALLAAFHANDRPAKPA